MMYLQPDYSDDSEGFSDDPDYENFKVRTSKKYELTPEQVKAQEREEVRQTLLSALNASDAETVFKIIDSGVSVNEEITEHWTPILLASSYGKPTILKGLIERGANVNSSHDGSTALILACSCSSYVSDHNDVVEVIDLLVKHGADVKATCKKRMTCLMYAASTGNIKAVQYLLPISNKDAVDNQHWTTLFWAVHSKNIDLIKYLLDEGFSTSCRDIRNLTPLNYAEANNLQEIVDLFHEEDNSILNNLHHCPSNSQEILLTSRPRMLRDICTILCALNSEVVIKYLVDTNVTLKDFLSVNENILKSWNIEMPFQRNRILNGLYRYHKKPYHPKSLLVINPKEVYSNKDVAIQVLCAIKQITSMDASLNFIINNREDLKKEDLVNLRLYISNIRRHLENIRLTTQRLESKVHQWDALVKPVDLIRRKSITWKPKCFVFACVSAITLFVYLKTR